MAKKTELKIANVLNDIYIKSKSKICFSLNEMRDHHNIGVGIWNILKNEKLIKKIDTGKYVYIGNSPTYELVKIIYEKYIEYNTTIMRDSVNKRSKEFTLFGEKMPKEYPKKEKLIEINKIGKLSEVRSKYAENKKIINLIQDNIHLILKSELSKINEQINEIKKEFKQLKDAIYNIDNYNEQIEKRLNGQIDYLSQELKNQNTAMYTIKDSQDRAINKLHLLSETPKKSFITKLFS